MKLELYGLTVDIEVHGKHYDNRNCCICGTEVYISQYVPCTFPRGNLCRSHKISWGIFKTRQGIFEAQESGLDPVYGQRYQDDLIDDMELAATKWLAGLILRGKHHASTN